MKAKIIIIAVFALVSVLTFAKNTHDVKRDFKVYHVRNIEQAGNLIRHKHPWKFALLKSIWNCFKYE